MTRIHFPRHTYSVLSIARRHPLLFSRLVAKTLTQTPKAKP